MTNRYRILSFQNFSEPLGGTAAGFFVTLSAAAKTNSDAVPYCVPNEYICGQLAHVLGLNVPPSGIMQSDEDDRVWFANLNFNETGEELPPIDVEDAMNEAAHQLAGVLAFDIWIANKDRHPNNLSFAKFIKPRRLDVFDHSHALFGEARDGGISQLERVGTRLGILDHCLADVVSDANSLVLWAEQIRQVPDFFIRNACNHVVGAGITQEEADAGYQFLTERKHLIRDLIGNNVDTFKALDSNLWFSNQQGS